LIQVFFEFRGAQGTEGGRREREREAEGGSGRQKERERERGVFVVWETGRKRSGGGCF